MQKVTIEEKIIIANSDKHFQPQLSLGKIDNGWCYVIQGAVRKPMTILKDITLAKGTFAYGNYQKVSEHTYNTIKEAIQSRQEYSMLDNYTFLIAYCLGKGVCLFEEGIFEMEDKKFL